MLESILASSPQSSILGFLVTAPQRSFTVKELQRRLHVSEAKVKSALQRLVKLGVVKSFRKGNQKFFLLNFKHKLLPELRLSVKKPRPRQDELFTAIKRLGEIRAAFLSGIFTGQPQLPVDLLLVGKVNLRKLDDFLANCRKLMGNEINYSIMTPEEFRMRRDTFDRFIKDIFDYRHVTVVDTLFKK